MGHADLALVRTVCGLGTRRCARALPLGRSRSPVRTDHGELEIGVKLVQRPDARNPDQDGHHENRVRVFPADQANANSPYLRLNTTLYQLSQNTY